MGGSVRPPDTPAKIWSKLAEYQQQSDALDYSLGRPGRVKDRGGGDSAASGTSSLPPLPLVASGSVAQATIAACMPMGILGLFGCDVNSSPANALVASGVGAGGKRPSRAPLGNLEFLVY